ncbi:MAG: hypothetical protein ACYTFA_02450 [Planctomycetota bacterium]|jgi:hypothetical protein
MALAEMRCGWHNSPASDVSGLFIPKNFIKVETGLLGQRTQIHVEALARTQANDTFAIKIPPGRSQCNHDFFDT